MKYSPVAQCVIPPASLRRGARAFTTRRGMLESLCIVIMGFSVSGRSYAATPVPPRSAQQIPELHEVVVTATKRAVPDQDVPFAITALDQRSLTARGADSADQALNYVPAVSFTSNGANSGTYTIRGISTGSAVANAQSPVALYIDDINILDPTDPNVTMNLRLFDVSRVEILEGPQGTLFGSGSLGGAIRIITNKPKLDRYEAEAKATVEDTHGGQVGYDVNAMVNIPLVTDKLAIRIVGYNQHYGGYVDNVRTGASDVNYATTRGGRVELKWSPLQDLSLLGTVLAEDDSPHDSAYSFYNGHGYQWNGAVPNYSYSNTKIYSLKGVFRPKSMTVTSITTYATRRESSLGDFTQTAEALLGLNAPSPITDAGPSHTLSQELRIASAGDQKFHWLIGGVYTDNRRTIFENVIIPGTGALFGTTSNDVSAADSFAEVQEEALYGELSYEILPRLTLTVGARRSHDKLTERQTIGGTLQVPSVTHNVTTENATTPRFNVSYHVTPDTMVYAQAAKGFRVGQINTIRADPISGQAIPLASNPDSLWNYELGEKSFLLRRRLIVDADVYYIDWRDIQLNALTVPSHINYITNAGHANIKGLEVNIEARPLAHWSTGGSLALTDAHLESVSPGVQANAGDRLPASAPLSADLYVEYTRPLTEQVGIFARIDARYVGKEYSNLENSTSLVYGRYSQLNIRGGLRWAHYTLTAFIENAANSNGKESAFDSFTVPVAIRQRPITFGLTVDARL